MPVFMVIVVGYVLKKIGMLNDEFIKVANKFNFNVTLPSLLLLNMMDCDIKHTFDGKYVLYCAITTITCIVVIWVSAKLICKDKTIVGEFVQGSYRGSAAILGIALLQNINGNSDMAPLMMLGSVPLYNIFAVIVLTFENPTTSSESIRKNIKKAILSICKNPIILSILGGMILSYFDITFPKIIYKTIDSVGSMTTPMALIVIGAGFEGGKAIKKLKPTVIASVIKLIIQPMIFLPLAVILGFEPEKIVAALIMLGAPTTATSYTMAKNMGHEGVLSSSIVVLTTLASAFTITMWIFILKTVNCI
jgi:predicted permease